MFKPGLDAECTVWDWIVAVVPVIAMAGFQHWQGISHQYSMCKDWIYNNVQLILTHTSFAITLYMYAIVDAVAVVASLCLHA